MNGRLHVQVTRMYNAMCINYAHFILTYLHMGAGVHEGGVGWGKWEAIGSLV